jgi:isopentenyl-diphosphate delta-isomerase
MKKLLKPVKLIGKVIPGEKIGRTINFPTANLALKILPPIKPGVYLAVCRLAKNSYLGLAYYSPRHTFEVYLFDFNQDIYGQKLLVKLTHFLRPPKKVSGLLALKKLIQQDLVSLNDQVILVNKKDQILGIANKIQAHLGSAQLHRAISVQIFNSKQELLIQQRSKDKLLFPLLWANTVCTDVRPYESYLQAARRRLKEEFGLTAKLKPMFKFFYTAPSGKSGSEREIDQVFFGLARTRPRPNPEEIAAWEYINLKAAKARLKTFAPWFQLILKKIPPSAIFKA